MGTTVDTFCIRKEANEPKSDTLTENVCTSQTFLNHQLKSHITYLYTEVKADNIYLGHISIPD